MKKVIFIGGTAYSGSTMLDMILSNDHKGYSLGEVNAMFRPYRVHHFEEIKTVKENATWRSLLEYGEKDFYKNVFNSFADIEFLVDSSKDPFWIANQSKISEDAGIAVKNILIYKTPLEIAHSFNKRNLYTKWERSWVNYYRLYFSLIDDFKAISYKELVTNPESLKRTCEFLDIPYFKNKQEFWIKEQNTFFGNNRTRFHTLNLKQKGDEKHSIKRNEYRKIYYENISDEKIIQKVEKRTNKNHYISLILSALIQNRISSNSSRIPSSLNFNHFNIFIRKSKDKILRLKADFKNYLK